MNELQIGYYFIAGILTMLSCYLLNNERSMRLAQYLVVVLLTLAIGYTLLSLAYFALMKQLGPFLTGIFVLSLHKIVIFFIDGMIIASIFIKIPPQLIAGRKLIYNFFRYFMTTYFICSGFSKIIGFSAILGFFQLSGYSILFLYFIIAFEIICGAALLFERTAAIAALMLILEMAGATFTHYHNYFENQVPDPFSNSLDSLKMLPFLLAIALIYKPKRNPVPKSNFKSIA